MLKYIAAIFTAFVLATSVAQAGSTPPKDIDKKQAVAIAKEAENGKVLKISEQREKFVVRILKPKGRVVDVSVSKRTGQVEKENN
ncbi:PepSY domain-containing protein [Pseudoalteromonas sp. MM17-2]|uniref:PepSY domain-containing protein n=1 Tax=unclassified Pseudoalteromonas TaxID=194690 RepID=UPI001022D934|nr:MULTISPECIES: PepSY domain-containing protein [unclassified Pseudoalteromonas]MCG7542823.1 PepSY domain-containing protein [Pseudoalteromonas sp. MM17-2]RZF80110.1 PepSY domain-containing protein [Pseudoalteromonas sp. CO325X]